MYNFLKLLAPRATKTNLAIGLLSLISQCVSTSSMLKKVNTLDVAFFPVTFDRFMNSTIPTQHLFIKKSNKMQGTQNML